MKTKVYKIKAFTKENKWGNPAWVVLDADNLSDLKMQEIAKKIWFSETAFVLKSKKTDFKVRFFTPNWEVDLCGHATIATFWLMSKLDLVQTWKYTQETRVGILDIEVLKNGTIFMSQNIPKFFEEIDKQEIAKSLNINQKIIDWDLPIQIVSTWLRDIVIPIKKLDDLLLIEPDFKKIAKISKKYNVVGYHLFSLETKLNSTAHCRNFAPLYDILEESATWTSNWALSCYLWKNNKLNNQNCEKLVYEQWYSMNLPSEILVSLKTKEKEIREVKVWGIAWNI